MVRSSQKQIRHILIRTPNYIGDTINITPCLQLVKQEYPEAKITIVCPDLVADVFKYDNRITQCIIFPLSRRKKWSTYWYILKSVRTLKADLSINFINTFISALLFKLAGVKYNIGYNHEGRGFLLDFKPKLNRNKHYINRYAGLFNEFIGHKYTYLPDLYLPVSGIKTFHFPNTGKTIGFYPGGLNKSPRNYPPEYAIQLIHLLQQQHFNVVLIGDQNDNRQQQEYFNRTAKDGNIVNLTGQTSVEDLFNTISEVDLLITIDSAAMHAAAALKTPFIALMGLSTSPTSTIVPKVDFGTILKIENHMIREEDFIKNITPETILQQVMQRLGYPI